MPIINVEKEGNWKQTKRQQMDEMMINICKQINQTDADAPFDAAATAVEIMMYTSKYSRLLYSSISNYIFVYGSESLDSNADALLDFACAEDFGNRLKEAVQKSKEAVQKSKYKDDLIGRIDALECQKIILKINDHIHLVSQQITNLKISDDEYSQKFEKQIQPVVDKVSDDMKEISKDINSQLITLIGMFTALAFIIFGGISEFNNIFSDISDISIFKLMMLGSVWGICLINLVYIFLFCIGKMTGLNFAASQKMPDASIFQKYPIVWWSNFIVIMILFINMWLYFLIYRVNIMDQITSLGSHSLLKGIIVVAGTIILILIIIGGIKYLIRHCNPDFVRKTKSNEKIK